MYLCAEVAHGIKVSHNIEGNGLSRKFLENQNAASQNSLYPEQITNF